MCITDTSQTTHWRASVLLLRVSTPLHQLAQLQQAYEATARHQHKSASTGEAAAPGTPISGQPAGASASVRGVPASSRPPATHHIPPAPAPTHQHVPAVLHLLADPPRLYIGHDAAQVVHSLISSNILHK